MKDFKKIVNIIGAPRNGTTLLGTLIDSHTHISSFPLEMKFVEKLRNVSIKKLNSIEFKEEFFQDSKIRYLLNKNNSDLYVNTNIGVFAPPQNFNFKLFKEIFLKKETKNIEEFIIKIHESLDLSLGIKPRNIIVIQDGNHLLKNDLIKFSMNNLTNAGFIMIYRNPLDTYVSYKKYSKNLKMWRHNIINFVQTFLDDYLTLVHYKEKNLKNFHFLNYENLVCHTDKEIQKICNFLKVELKNTLKEPTIFGNEWFSNSLPQEKSIKIATSFVDVYKNHLNEIEQKFIFVNFNTAFYHLYSSIKNNKEGIKRFKIVFMCLKSFKDNTKKNWKFYFKFLIIMKYLLVNLFKKRLIF